MVALPFVAVGFLMTIVAILFMFVALALILIILLQKGRGGGLSAAFGGGGAGGILGSKTGDFLTWVTIVLVFFFLVLAVIMAKFYKPSTEFGITPDPNQSQQDVPSPDTSTTDLSTEINDVKLSTAQTDIVPPSTDDLSDNNVVSLPADQNEP